MSLDATKDRSATVTREPQELEHQIHLRAYGLYEARGRENGHDLPDWFRRSEEEIKEKKVRTAVA